MENPLTKITGLPTFSTVKAEHIKEAVVEAVENCKKTVIAVVDKNKENPTWDNVIAPIEEADDRFSKIWSVVSHLNSVQNTDKWREAYEECLPIITEYSTFVGQYKPLFEAMVKIKDSDAFGYMTRAQRKSIENSIREFKLTGIDLDESAQKRFLEVSQELSLLQSKFANNVLDATYGFFKHVTDEKLLQGLPQSVLNLAKSEATKRDLEGYVFTLEIPSYVPLLTYADNRELRHEMHVAYNTRASELEPNANKWDNSPIIDKILALRQELAELLGFETYAHYSLATKMASDPKEVIDFLEDLGNKSLEQGKKEVQTLEAFAKEQGIDELKPWDVAYFSEKLRQKEYSYNAEELRPYFPVDKVVQGLFECASRVFSISFRPRFGVDTWHESVKCYDIYDEFGSKIGTFYLDLYARQGKRGGAWMDECQSRRYRIDGALQLPVAYLVCNFTPPINGKQSELTHDEVVTLFHEFGHGLNQLLTRIDIADVSGINGVPWDAVELPSQFNENFAWQEEVLSFLSNHVKTHKPLPKDKLDSLIKAKNFQSAMSMLRQLTFALFDFKVHYEYKKDGVSHVYEILKDVVDKYGVVPRFENSRFPNSFNHIFAGGYAAGYYSYKWAEVLAADAFGRFEEEGIFSKEAGRDFRDCILATGGALDPMSTFIAFRGRKPSVDALLKQSGIDYKK